MRLPVESFQRLGRALMLPIAVLPLAGLLLRLGQPDLLDLPFLAAAGDALFAHLGLLFAAGIAIGYARDNHGAASLAGVVCFLVLTEGAKTLLAVPPDVPVGPAVQVWRDGALTKLSVPAGIAAGLVSGLLYNRFHTIKVPEYLAFFGGRRFVPLAAGGAGLIGALLLGFGLPVAQHAIDGLSAWTMRSGPVGLFVYGVANRLLLVTGLHHILNNMAWFVVGDYHGATGDLKRFFAGDPTAGSFMAGFFPVMMFGLPAACLAMYRAAPPERRGEVGGLFASLALTSFLTGVTEPIEFTFLFLAPALYAFHAVMTGVGMVIMDALGVKLGFTFSAGFADFTINYGLATRPLLLLPVGLAYGAVYFAVFTFAIRRFNLATPGRESEGPVDAQTRTAASCGRADGLVRALGGAANIVEVDACTTRLRLTLADPARVDEAALRGLGARGIVRPGGRAVQVILGPVADLVAAEVRERLAQSPPAVHGPSPEPEPGAADLLGHPALPTILAAFGGARNVLHHAVCGNRVLVTVRDEPLDLHALRIEGLRGIVHCEAGSYQVVLGAQ